MWRKLERLSNAVRSIASPRRVEPSSEDGQSLVEYTLILALIAIAALAALTQLGSGIVETLNQITGTL